MPGFATGRRILRKETDAILVMSRSALLGLWGISNRGESKWDILWRVKLVGRTAELDGSTPCTPLIGSAGRFT